PRGRRAGLRPAPGPPRRPRPPGRGAPSEGGVVQGRDRGDPRLRPAAGGRGRQGAAHRGPRGRGRQGAGGGGDVTPETSEVFRDFGSLVLQAPNNCKRTRFRANFAVRLCTSARVPVQLKLCERTPPSQAMPTWTLPTGLSAVAPAGPATPTVLTARSVRKRVRQPTAMASATAALTAPCSSRHCCGTAS